MQLVANITVFIGVNIIGLVVNIMMERAQRRTFLDTRNCIAARLEMEDENEKLERLLLSVLPQHVAMEMKNDILSPVQGQFHKIYIQKHENVRYVIDDDTDGHGTTEIVFVFLRQKKKFRLIFFFSSIF